MKPIAILSWFGIFLSTLVVHADDWPTYMHDRTRVGYTPETLDTTLQQQWVRHSAAPPQWAWPGPGGKVVEGLALKHRVRFDDVFHVVAADNLAYYGSSVDNTVYCVDPATGETRWRFVTSAPVRLAPSLDDGRLYVGSDDGRVYCLDARDGQLLWQLRAGPADEWILARGRMASRWPVRTGVLVDQGIAYFGAGVFPHETVYLYAVDAKSGETVWRNDTISQRDAGRNDLTPQGYLLASDQRLFVPSNRTLPAAFDRQTGELLHKQLGGGKQIGGTAALLDEDDLLSVGEHHILSLDQEKGSIDNRLRGHRMTLHERMAYVADGKVIMAVDRPQFAQVKQQRLDLEAKLARAQRGLNVNHATIHLERVRDSQAALAKARQQQSQETESQIAELELRVASAAKTYETSRQAFVKLTADVEALRSQIDQVTAAAVQWRTETNHESSMILAGNILVVGGASEVVLIDTQTGQLLQTLPVEAEARGLAVADGRLYVSTTAGKIYCFGSGEAAVVTDRGVARDATSEPFPQDEQTELYAQAAEQILRRSGVTRGYCLVVGNGKGRLAYELAKRSALKLHCVDTSQQRVLEAREALADSGLYGHRISIEHVELATYPYPNYFANLIVCDSLLEQGTVAGDPQQVVRHLKPDGGVLCLGVPEVANDDVRRRADNEITAWVAETGMAPPEVTVASTDGWTTMTRQSLPGTSGWTHQYGNPANTSTVYDDRIKGGIRVLWYGDPGPSTMLNRHQGAVGPVSAAGRLFMQGDDRVMAYDAFNGEFLWDQYNPQALRTGVFNNYEPGNLVASDTSLFMVSGEKCVHYDAGTGAVIRTYEIPQTAEDGSRQWGYVAYADGRLYGTNTTRKMIAAEARRRGRASEHSSTDQVFAFDTETGKLLWDYQGQSIAHTTIAIDDGRLYFVDSSLTADQREALLREDKSELLQLEGEARQVAEDRVKRLDARRAVALDAATGDVVWSQSVDVTDCTGVGIGAGRLTVMVADGYLVLCGANANGHYWKQFLAGEFKRRRVVVLSAADGTKLWAKDANYRHRPIIVGNRLIAEPWAFALDTGDQLMRRHPLTGEQTPWKFIRPGHHCGAISATPNLMFFRSGFTAYYDFDVDGGTNHFAGHRLGCWINTIPANGLVMIPEASAGCACLFSLTSTIVFEPRGNQQVWSVYTAEGETKPVRHMALNLGAPGDRRDARGKLWLGYPRPSSRPGLDLPIDIHPQSPFGATGSAFQYNSASYRVANTELPWVHSSGMIGMTRCRLPLIDAGQGESNYRVRLYFAALENDQPGQRVFSIRLQGKTVQERVDIVKQAGHAKHAVRLEFRDVSVQDDLVIELQPSGSISTDHLPVICAIEVVREGSSEILRQVATSE